MSQCVFAKARTVKKCVFCFQNAATRVLLSKSQSTFLSAEIENVIKANSIEVIFFKKWLE